MHWSILAVLAGFGALIWGADRFVIGAAAMAGNLGVSALLIGLTVVGLGTSAPEILVSAMAAWEGNPGLAIGNALGSNITNISLILGVTALVSPLSVHSQTLQREYPLMLACCLVALLLVMDGQFGRLDGMILLAGLVVVLFWIVRLGLGSRIGDPLVAEYEAELPHKMPTRTAVLWFGIGLLVLLLGSRLVVWGAVNIAQALGISDLVIGLTVVAIGTSLPELAASVMSAIKREHDLAIGNVIGSNIYNLLAVLSLPGIIRPGPFPPDALMRDFPIMIGLTLALFAFGYGFKGPGRINRLEGAILLLSFGGYELLLYSQA